MLDFKDLLPIGIVAGVLGITLAYTAQVTGDVQDDMTADSYEYNVTESTLQGMDNLAGKIPTILLIVAISVLVGVLIRNLWFKG